MKNIIQKINPLEVFGASLYDIKKPSRYLGGELGSHPQANLGDSRLSLALCFPDMYEIGMSNNAIRILYNDLGETDREILCERVFAPAPDYRALLQKKNVPLHSLESGIPLRDFDILGFSVGYELLATNILAVLESGKIPLLSEERGKEDPIVIAGGPAVTNPKPLSPFLDAVYIGEAEGEFYAILRAAAQLKRQGQGREDILELLRQSAAFWMPKGVRHEEKHAWKAMYADFTFKPASTAYPVPVLQTVQSHGTVEIMRGCPNGCRFCHAGYLYRPQRVKAKETIKEEVKNLVALGGYKEITLASLSSGDYPEIAGLLDELNSLWKGKFVSFQLPSLKVDSFTLPLIAQLSEVRKSGLTFAVETPNEDWQRRINKSVDFEKIMGILAEARKYGFKSAKFYFMIGLPVPGKGRGEGEEIAAFLDKIAQRDRMPLNVNIGTFIPKPHTPYEREAQIDEKTALETIYYIKDALRRHRHISISYHSPFTSTLEGLISRGDERAASIILSAYRRGACFDAWDDYFNKAAWEMALDEARERDGYDPRIEFLGQRADDAPLPWDSVHLFVGKGYFQKEKECSEGSLPTSACEEDCSHPCGSCNDKFGLILDTLAKKAKDAHASETQESTEYLEAGFSQVGEPHHDTLEDQRLVISYTRTGAAVFYPLHSFATIFTRAFEILGLPARYSEGFNPAPKIELNQPLALGIESEEELLAVWLDKDIYIHNKEIMKNRLQALLPAGIRVNEIRLGKRRREGKNTIGSMYLGSRYSVSFDQANLAQAFFSSIRDNPHCANAGLSHDSLTILVDVFDARGKESSLTAMLKSSLGTESILGGTKIIRKSILCANKDLGVGSASEGCGRLFEAL